MTGGPPNNSMQRTALRAAADAGRLASSYAPGHYVVDDSSARLGAVLENLVTTLHSAPGVTTRTRVRLPVIGSASGRTREIDVLLDAEVAGYRVRLAIECKNEQAPVGTEYIDAFVGKLSDVGIPVPHGIFVSASGYTRPGLERAEAAGIRTLVLEGLTPDRLTAAIETALATYVYVGCEVRGYDRFTDHAEALAQSTAGELLLEPRHGHGLAAVNNFVWEHWVRGRLADDLGEQVLFLRLPPGFRFEPKGRVLDGGLVIVTLQVRAHVGTLMGEATHVRLRNATTAEVEKARIDTSFQPVSGALPLVAFGAKDELTTHLQSRQAEHLLTHTVRVPRIVVDRLYWPPSRDALERIRQLRADGKEVTFADVEGYDLSRAWEATILHDDA